MPFTKFPRRIAFLAALILPLLLAAPALADGPAVSAINGKVEGFVGTVNGDASGGGAAVPDFGAADPTPPSPDSDPPGITSRSPRTIRPTAIPATRKRIVPF